VTGAKWSGSHRRLAEKLKPHALGKPCHFCGRPMLPGQALDLDHAPDGGYRGVAHASCNRSAGGRQGKLVQMARRRARSAREARSAGRTAASRNRRRGFILGNEVALGVEIAIDRAHTSVVVAGRGRDECIVVELAAYLEGTSHGGTVRDMVVSRGTSKVLAVMIDPRSPAATLVDPLKALGVEVTEASTHVVAAAHGDFLDELRAGRLAIEKHSALDAAAKYAMSRQLAGGEALERRKPSVDASPILAAELATWAVLHILRQVTRIHVYDPNWAKVTPT
jgi:hypothetical protein